MFGAPCNGKLIVVIEINCPFRVQPVVCVHFTGRCPVLNYVALSARCSVIIIKKTAESRKLIQPNATHWDKEITSCLVRPVRANQLLLLTICQNLKKSNSTSNFFLTFFLHKNSVFRSYYFATGRIDKPFAI